MSDTVAMVVWVTVAVLVSAAFTILVVGRVDSADRRDAALKKTEDPSEGES